jgi:hypothetical protein
MMKTPYTLDLVLELNGEWHDKQRIAGIPDPNSGGTTVYLSPGVRVGFDRFSGFVSSACRSSTSTTAFSPSPIFACSRGSARG